MRCLLLLLLGVLLMPVSWVKVEMPLGGIDAQADPVHVLPGKLLSLVNGRFDQPGGISKRVGYSQRATTGYPSTDPPTSGNRLLELAGGEQLIQGDRKLWSWSPLKSAWVSRGYVPNVYVSRESVYSDSLITLREPDIATNTITGVEILSWQGGKNMFQIRDTKGADAVELSQGTVLVGANPMGLGKVVIVGGIAFGVQVDVTTIKFVRINTADAEPAPSALTAFAGPRLVQAGKEKLLAVMPAEGSSDRFLVAWVDNGAGNRLKVELWSTASTPVSQWVADLGETADEAIALRCQASDNLVWVSWHLAGTGVRAATLDYVTGAVGTVATVDTATDVNRITIARLSSSRALMVWENRKVAGTSPSARLPFVEYAQFNTSIVQVGSTLTISDVAILADAYLHLGRVFLPVCHTGAGYGTGYLMEIGETTTPSALTAHWEATFAVDICQPDLADDNTSSVSTWCPHVTYNVLTASADFPIRVREKLQYAKDDDGDIIRSHDAIARVRIVHGSSSRNWVTWGPSAFLSSARPSWYDGVGLAEHGFSWPPSVDRDSTSGTGANGDLTSTGAGPFLANEVYQVQLCWVFEDSNGVQQISEPSKLMQRTVSGANQLLRVTLRNSLLTDRGNVAQSTGTPWWHFGTGDPRVQAYRTKGQGGTAPGPRFYRAEGTEGFLVPTYPSGVGTDIDLNDVDTAIATREVLYTDGGILTNATTPPHDVSCVAGGRLWLGKCEEPRDLYFAQPFVEREAPRFNPYMKLRMDEPVVGLGPMDDVLVVFSSGSLRRVVGAGPPASGGLDIGFATELVSSDVGVSGHRTIVPAAAGLFFHSSRGFMLLDRGFSLNYIGAPVERILAATPTIIAGALVPQQSQVRWLCKGTFGEGTIFLMYVYDYKADAWSVDQMPLGGVDIYTFGRYTGAANQFSLLNSIGEVFDEGTVTAVYTDDGLYVPLSFTTPWIKLDTLQGWQRVRSVTILGRKPEGVLPDFDVSIGYDYEDAFSQTRTFTTADFAALTGQRLQMKVRFARQKCQAFRVQFTDKSNAGGGFGAKLRISSLVFEAGLKRGTMKLPVGVKK